MPTFYIGSMFFDEPPTEFTDEQSMRTYCDEHCMVVEAETLEQAKEIFQNHCDPSGHITPQNN